MGIPSIRTTLYMTVTNNLQYKGFHTVIEHFNSLPIHTVTSILSFFRTVVSFTLGKTCVWFSMSSINADALAPSIITASGSAKYRKSLKTNLNFFYL